MEENRVKIEEAQRKLVRFMQRFGVWAGIEDVRLIWESDHLQ